MAINFKKLIFFTTLITLLLLTPLIVALYTEPVPQTLRSGIPSMILLLFLTAISADQNYSEDSELDVVVLFSFFFALF